MRHLAPAPSPNEKRFVWFAPAITSGIGGGRWRPMLVPRHSDAGAERVWTVAGKARQRKFHSRFRNTTLLTRPFRFRGDLMRKRRRTLALARGRSLTVLVHVRLVGILDLRKI